MQKRQDLLLSRELTEEPSEFSRQKINQEINQGECKNFHGRGDREKIGGQSEL